MADQRKTLDCGSNFYDMLHSCFVAQEPVRLLYDKGGMQRAEGIIQHIDPPGPESSIKLTNGQRIAINDIVAVNGVFSDEYTEC
ncbi:MAG: hypothetical protein NZL95_08730 [Chitinophagales bacterium]|nr:hypothetical protein [Chitinophagales bacterium]MDW8428621.1 hypothetical protein [Chitinophagales bacterium]